MKQLLSAMVALACGVALADEPAKSVVTMTGGTFDAAANDGRSMYDKAASTAYPAIHWSDNEAPHTGADYSVPAGYTLGIGQVQGPVDFGGDSLIIGGALYWYGGWDAQLKCTKPTVMKPGSAFYFQLYGNYVYNPFLIEGTVEKPVKFYTSGDDTAIQYVYLRGKFTCESETSCMKFYLNDTKPYGRRIDFTGADLSDYNGILRTTGGKSYIYATRLSFPGSFEAVDGGFLHLTGASGESSFANLKIGSDAKLQLGQDNAKNTHVVRVTNRLVIEDGATLVIGKVSNTSRDTSLQELAEAHEFPIFRLTAAAFANPETVIGVPNLKIGFSLADLPHGEIYTNVVDESTGEVEIGWRNRPIVHTLRSTGWGMSPFMASKDQTGCLSDGLPMHDCDYYIGHYVYPQVDKSPYICPSPYLVFTSQQSWYSTQIYFTNVVFYGGVYFQSYDGGHGGYKIMGNARVVPANGLGGTFESRNGHEDVFSCNLTGSGLLKFGYLATFDTDALSRWYAIFSLYGTNTAFTGKMSFNMCADGSCPAAFENKGFDPFVQGEWSNITVRVNNPYSFGGALDAFDPEAIVIGHENRIEVNDDVAFEDLNRGWTFTTNGYLRVKAGKTLTLKNRVALGGELHTEATGTLVLGGTLTRIQDSFMPGDLYVDKGKLAFASQTAIDGVSLHMAAGTSLVVDLAPADETFKATGLLVNGGIDFTDKIAVELRNVPEAGTAKVALMTIVSDCVSDVTDNLTLPTLAGYSVSLTAEENERQPDDDVTTSTIFLTVKRRPLALFVR